jgi:hypothetical protein
VDAEGLRGRAAQLLEQAKAEHDPADCIALIELAVALIVKARELDQGKKLN